jgi:surface protein
MKMHLNFLFILFLISCSSEEPTPTFSLNTISIPTEGGRITVSPQSPNYKVGEIVTLTPEPNENWVFQQWEGDVSGTSNPLQITMNSNKSVVGIFVKRNYPLNITIEGEGTVEEKIVTNPSGREYPHGTTVELTPTPKEGWVFDSWGGDLSGTESPKTISIDKEKSVIVKFRNPVFRLAENGITCICENVKPGDKGFINGVEFEAVDNDLIRKRRDERDDMTKLCTSLVTNMSDLFPGITDEKNNFNQPIGNWDVSNVTSMQNMFFYSSFNQPIGNWNVSNVKNMEAMFDFTDFNKPIGNWNVSNVTNMGYMFEGSPFNQPIGNWDVSNVTAMSHMFSGSLFNQPIGNWDVSNVTIMEWMFNGSPFNQPLENWGVLQVTDMSGMFNGAEKFNQDISKWCVSKISSEPQLFSFNSPLSPQFKPKWGTCPD